MRKYAKAYFKFIHLLYLTGMVRVGEQVRQVLMKCLFAW